jgi:hypothetical protein
MPRFIHKRDFVDKNTHVDKSNCPAPERALTFLSKTRRPE